MVSAKDLLKNHAAVFLFLILKLGLQVIKNSLQLQNGNETNFKNPTILGNAFDELISNL
jgi:hypothetical protein